MDNNTAVTVTTNATLIKTANERSGAFTITNNSDVTIYIGFTSAVTVANGRPVFPYQTIDFDLDFGGFNKRAIYGICGSSADIRFMGVNV